MGENYVNVANPFLIDNFYFNHSSAAIQQMVLSVPHSKTFPRGADMTLHSRRKPPVPKGSIKLFVVLVSFIRGSMVKISHRFVHLGEGYIVE